MTSISGLSIGQWLQSTGAGELKPLTLDTQDSGNTSATATGDTVSISAEGRQLLSARPAQANAQDGQDDSADSSGGGAMAAGAGGAFGTSAESATQEQIEELEQKIEEVGKEIAQLQSEAASNPTAKAQLNAKLNELSHLRAQLAELKQQQKG